MSVDTFFHILFVFMGTGLFGLVLAFVGMIVDILYSPLESDPKEKHQPPSAPWRAPEPPDPWRAPESPAPWRAPEPPAPQPSPRPTEYTRDWAAVSRRPKEMSRWTCKDCGVCLEADRNLLHVHHRDQNPQNNAPHNLEALCVICHSGRPGAGHRRLAGAIFSDGRRWRVEQHRRRW